MIRLKKQNINECIKSISKDNESKNGKKGKGANRKNGNNENNGKNLKNFKKHGFCVTKKGKGQKV